MWPEYITGFLYQKETILFFLHKFNDQLCQCIPTFSEYEILKQQIGQKKFAANFTKKNLAASQKIFFLPLMLNTVSGSSPSSMMFAVNHSFLDITALIPSPDWLIGVDSLELCKDERNEHEDNVKRNSTITLGDLHRDPLAHHGP